MQLLLEQFLKNQNIQAECKVTDEGQSIHVKFSLPNKEWAVNYITLEKDKIHVSAWNSLGNSMMDMVERHEKGVSPGMEQTFRIMCRLWGLLLQEKPNIRVLLVNMDANRFGRDAFDLLKEKGLVQLQTPQKNFVQGHFGYEADWLLSIDTNDVVQGIRLAHQVGSHLLKKQQNDPTMVVYWQFEEGLLHLYYRGWEETIETKIENGQLHFTYGENNEIVEVVQDEESAQILFETFFSSIEEKELDATKYFDDFMKQVMIRTSIIERIYDQLRGHYSSFEIETFAAKRLQHIEETKKAVLYNEEMKLFRYLSHYLLLDYDTSEVLLYEEKEPAVTLFRESVLKKKSKKLDEQLQLFLIDDNTN